MGNSPSSNPPPDSVDRKFYIISRLDDNSVIHVENDSTEAGAKVIITPVRLDEDDPTRANRLWYYDFITRTVRTNINDYCLDIDGKIYVILFTKTF